MSAPLLSITHQPPAETEKEKSGAWVKKLIHTRPGGARSDDNNWRWKIVAVILEEEESGVVTFSGLFVGVCATRSSNNI
jgi:hypothetical protein